jgi:hypothetical protein
MPSELEIIVEAISSALGDGWLPTLGALIVAKAILILKKCGVGQQRPKKKAQNSRIRSISELVFSVVPPAPRGLYKKS